MASFTVTEELADFVESAVLVAVNMTAAGFGTMAGAVNKPDDDIVPRVLFPPAVLLTDQVTVWLGLLVPCTLALHWSADPTCRFADAQETVTEVTVGAELPPPWLFPPPPPQADSRMQLAETAAKMRRDAILPNPRQIRCI
jgi:hypothetical protein